MVLKLKQSLPRGVLFDLGNTLLFEEYYRPVDGGAALLEMIPHSPEITPERLQKEARKLVIDLAPRRKESLIEISWATFHRLLLGLFNLELPSNIPDAEIAYWNAASKMSPAQGVETMLDRLCGMGIRCGVVSNSIFSSNALSWILQQHHLHHYFEFVISSADIGIRKPHPLIFALAATRLDMSYEEIWYIGDRILLDVWGSSSAGMTGVWYNPRRTITDEMQPEIELVSWTELCDLLKK
ncbi:MAG: HAD-IA family hydrolase [Chitinivibrionales bacterium]|nr:HAD-IA family hydrolase [Chitinivibrionales bacterium]